MNLPFTCVWESSGILDPQGRFANDNNSNLFDQKIKNHISELFSENWGACSHPACNHIINIKIVIWLFYEARDWNEELSRKF